MSSNRTLTERLWDAEDEGRKREAVALRTERLERMVMACVSGNIAETRLVTNNAPADTLASMVVHLAKALLVEIDDRGVMPDGEAE